MDPVEGGSANDYDYANQDCVNSIDLSGRKPNKGGWLQRHNKCMEFYKPLNDFYKAISVDYEAITDWVLGVARGEKSKSSLGLKEIGRFINRQSYHRMLKKIAKQYGLKLAKLGTKINPLPLAAGTIAQGVMNGYCEIQAFRGKTY